MATTKLRGLTTRRRVLAASVAAGTLLSLAACSSDTSPTSTASTDGGDTNVTGTLEILVSSASASDAAFEEVTAAFEDAYPDVTVNLTSVDNDNYPATKSSRLTAGNVDIFVVKNFRDVPEYAADSTPEDVLLAQAGMLLDLGDQDFMSNYTSTVLDAQSVGGKTYAVPTGLSYSTGVYYNKTLFEQLGLSVPTTWTELQSVVTAVEAAGDTAFAIGGKDSWPAGLVMLGVTGSTYTTDAAKQDAAASFWSGDAALDSGAPLEILDKTQWVFGHAQANFAGAGYDDIPGLFAAGDVAMTVDGTWNNPTILGAVGDSFEVGYFPFPGSDTAADNAYLNGKIELQLAVAQNAPNKDAALAWLEFFSDPANYAKFVATSGYASAQPDISTSDFLNSIADYTSEFRSAWDVIWVANNNAGQDAVFPFNYPALSPLGTSSAQDAASAAQKSWSAALGG